MHLVASALSYIGFPCNALFHMRHSFANFFCVVLYVSQLIIQYVDIYSDEWWAFLYMLDLFRFGVKKCMSS